MPRQEHPLDVKSLVVIGDVHCKMGSYALLCATENATVQVGDLCVREDQLMKLMYLCEEESAEGKVIKDFFIPGNHDNYNLEICGTESDPSFAPFDLSLGDFGLCSIVKGIEFFFIRGADSVDKERRTEGIDWWPEEEMSYGRFQHCIDSYEQAKPSIVISHTAPKEQGFHLIGGRFTPSITEEVMQQMFEIHQPDLWIHGHFHISKQHKLNGTKFVSLAELETYTI